MIEDIISLIKENIIQGRITKDDEGMDEGMVGQPGVSELIDTALTQGVNVADIINQGLTKGMETVGQKFEAEEYFIPDMLASAEAVGAAMEILEPHLARSGIKAKGKIIIATVQGDLHDIGKNIVSILLRGAGYTVKDLGNDIDPQTIVEAVREEKPEFLGMLRKVKDWVTYGKVDKKIVVELFETRGMLTGKRKVKKTVNTS